MGFKVGQRITWGRWGTGASLRLNFKWGFSAAESIRVKGYMEVLGERSLRG